MKKNMVSDNLENIIMKLDKLQGISRVCAVAFQHKEAFSALSSKEVSNTFENIISQVEDIRKDLDTLVNEVITAEKIC